MDLQVRHFRSFIVMNASSGEKLLRSSCVMNWSSGETFKKLRCNGCLQVKSPDVLNKSSGRKLMCDE